MRALGRFLFLPVALALLLLCSYRGASAEQEAVGSEVESATSNRWALLIGVDRYAKPGLANLDYCGADARALREVLILHAGFPKEQVVVLHDEAEDARLRPTRDAMVVQLRNILERSKDADLLLIAFSGHGVHLDKSYLCPADADVHHPAETMIAVPDLYALLNEKCYAEHKVLFIDACRNQGGQGRAIQVETLRRLPEGFARSLARVPPGLWCLSSCQAGQVSFENPELGHGVFMYFLMEGLRGAADSRAENPAANGDGVVDAHELFHFARQRTDQFVKRRHRPPQVPELFHLGSDIPPLARLPQRQQRLVNDVGMEFVLIPRGKFTMGSPDGEGHQNERPRREVWITEDFYLGVTEVTQQQYEAVMGRNPSYFSPAGRGAARVQGRDTSKLPVERVNYHDAVEFCRKLAEREGLPAGSYRLPTEAEWEYAARAGTTAEYGPAGSPLGLSRFAWYDEMASRRTHEVGSLQANEFGLYDMQGNVAEWCSDWYDPDYYQYGPREDPQGPAKAVRHDWKLLRGGAWCLPEAYCRMADRNAMSAVKRELYAGFRVVRVIDVLGK